MNVRDGEAYVPPVNAFTETSALWHLLEGRIEEVRRILDELPYEERVEFAARVRALHRLIAESATRRLPTSEELGG